MQSNKPKFLNSATCTSSPWIPVQQIFNKPKNPDKSHEQIPLNNRKAYDLKRLCMLFPLALEEEVSTLYKLHGENLILTIDSLLDVEKKQREKKSSLIMTKAQMKRHNATAARCTPLTESIGPMKNKWFSRPNSIYAKACQAASRGLTIPTWIENLATGTTNQNEGPLDLRKNSLIEKNLTIVYEEASIAPPMPSKSTSDVTAVKGTKGLKIYIKKTPNGYRVIP